MDDSFSRIKSLCFKERKLKMYVSIGIIFICSIILYFMIFKKNNKPIIDDKIKSMSVEEYNNYLKNDVFFKVKEKIKNIIDIAYQDYINECKSKGEYIDDFFFIYEGTYGITKDDIKSFLHKRKTKIKNYKVKWHAISYSYIPPCLFVDVLKEKN